MKIVTKTPITRLTEKFDRQLLRLLKNELAVVKETKEQIIKSLKSDDGLQVA